MTEPTTARASDPHHLADSDLPQGVLWDMDGTLIDTEPYWIRAETDLVRAHGGTWSTGDGLALVGNPLRESGAVLQRAGVDLEVSAIVDLLIARVVEQLHRRVPWCPGARELLAELRAAQVPCALVTMSYWDVTVPVLADLPPGTFAVTVTGDMVTHSKPHPEPYLTAAARLGVQPHRCVAIEDSVPGIGSALAAGARTVGVQRHVPVPQAPHLSRIESLTSLDLATLGQIVGGVTIDLLGEGLRSGEPEGAS